MTTAFDEDTFPPYDPDYHGTKLGMTFIEWQQRKDRLTRCAAEIERRVLVKHPAAERLPFDQYAALSLAVRAEMIADGTFWDA